jgi:hypothetical protein
MDLAEELRIPRNGMIQGSQISKERHPRRAVLHRKGLYCAREIVDFRPRRFTPVPTLRRYVAEDRHLYSSNNLADLPVGVIRHGNAMVAGKSACLVNAWRFALLLEPVVDRDDQRFYFALDRGGPGKPAVRAEKGFFHVTG